MNSLLIRIAILGAVVLVCASCAVLADGSRLAVGDIIGVTVDGEKEFTKPYQINNEGYISLSQVGSVKVEGLNTTDAAAAIAKELGNLLVNPQVTVTFIERGKMQVFVVGQVTRPGLIEVGVGDRVIQALAQAGYDDTADLSDVSIQRGDAIIAVDLTKYLSGEDISVNVKLQSGDTIRVRRSDMSGTVMVLGKVSKTGSIPIKTGMTFRDLMGLVGDVTIEADREKITITREGQAEPIKVDYQRAMDDDPSANIVLMPGDKIFVPEVETAFFTIYGGVARTGQYPLKGRLTLSEAIGLAGGAIPNLGDLRKVQVTRAATADGPGDTFTVDINKVRAGNEQEPLVKRGDVIYVAEHKRKPGIMEIIQMVLPFGWLFR